MTIRTDPAPPSVTAAWAKAYVDLSQVDKIAGLLVAAPLILSFVQVYAVVRDVHLSLADAGYLTLVVGAVILYAKRLLRPQAAPLLLPFALIVLTTFLAALFALPSSGFRGLRELAQVLRDITCFYALFAVLAGRPRVVRILALAFLWIAVGFAIAGIGSAILSGLEANRPAGTYQRPELLLGTGYSQFMWPAAVVAFAELAFARTSRYRMAMIFASSTVASAVLIGYGRGPLAVIGLAILTFLLISRHRKPLLIGLALSVVATAVVLVAVPNIRFGLAARFTTFDLTGDRYVVPANDGTVRPYNSEYTRLVLWRTGLAMVAASPLIGHGPGNFTNEMIKFLPNDTPIPPEIRRLGDVDNHFLQIAIDSGMLGLGAYLLLVALCARRAAVALKRRHNLGEWANPAVAGAVFVLLWPVTDLYQVFVGDYVVRAFFVAIPFLALSDPRVNRTDLPTIRHA